VSESEGCRTFEHVSNLKGIRDNNDRRQGGIDWRIGGCCDTGVSYEEICEEDFITTVSLVRRSWEGERFNLGQFIEWSLFLL